MNFIQCSICHRAAAWMIDTEAFGIDRFPVRRLTESDEVFRTGGRFSKRRKAKQKKRGGDALRE
jgi:hypothetical protein